VEDEQYHNIEDILISHSSEDGPKKSSPQESLKDMKSIEPKSIFANERTWLHYSQKGIYVLGVSVWLQQRGGDYKIVSTILTLVTIVYFVVVYMQFELRQKNLTAKMAVGKDLNEKLNISSGPILAAAMIILGSAVSIVASCA